MRIATIYWDQKLLTKLPKEAYLIQSRDALGRLYKYVPFTWLVNICTFWVSPLIYPYVYETREMDHKAITEAATVGYFMAMMPQLEVVQSQRSMAWLEDRNKATHLPQITGMFSSVFKWAPAVRGAV